MFMTQDVQGGVSVGLEEMWGTCGMFGTLTDVLQ